MAIIDTLKVYESLKVEMPDRSAKAVAKALELSFEEYRVNQGEFLVTKQEMTEFRSEVRGDLTTMKQEMTEFRAEVREDLAAMKQEMAEFRAVVREDLASMRQDMVGFRAEIKQEMAELRAATDAKIAGVKTDLIRWMFIFWVGQIGVLATFLFALR